jgi:benzoate membrane transport protein
MVQAFALIRLRSPAWAVLAALALGLVLAFATGAARAPEAVSLPALVLVTPRFDAGLLLDLAMPLALVTMAGQNLPGFAAMRAAGFQPRVNAALTATGLISAGTGLFGAHPTNMAAITAAICVGDEVHPDRTQR